MFESLKVEESTTTQVVTAAIDGNPFVIKGIIGLAEDKFKGMSFIEVRKGNVIVPCNIYCADYGVVHSYEGEDKDQLDTLVSQLNSDLQDRYGITFLVQDPPMDIEGPTPPEEED